MNGRIYDPTLGRFLQADPLIQAPNDSQSYNRYAYVRNNPLTLTDPSGYSWLSKAWKKIKPFIGVIIVAVASFYCAGTCTAGMWAAIGGTAGGVSAAVNGGNIVTGALMGAFTAGAAQYGMVASAVAGGIASKVQGGKFGHGFWAAGVGAAIGGGYGKGWAKVVTAAVVGGTISKLTGGKFKNGAISAAFSAAMANAASEYKNRPLEEGSAEWEAREEEYFQAEQKEMMNALATGKDILASNWDWMENNFTGEAAKMCRATCIDTYYGDTYDKAKMIAGGGAASFVAKETAKYLGDILSQRSNQNLWGDSRRGYNVGARQLRMFKQFNVFMGFNAVVGVGAKSFQLTADAYCAIECYGGE